MAMLTSLPDADLLDLLKSGDHAAFTEIYKRYWQKIYVIANKRLRDDPESEEIVQDIFLNLWKRRFNITNTIALPNYFAVAVKFEIIDLMRKRAIAAKYDKEVISQISEADYATLRDLDLLEVQRQLQFAINALPDKCKLVFNLKHQDGYTQKQIAEELDISEKTVEAHLATAKKKLRTSFGTLLPALLVFYFL